MIAYATQLHTKFRNLACSLLAIAGSLYAASAAVSRPNVVFIVADDFRADAIHALGNPHVHTPNLDRLVKMGSVFKSAYTMGSTGPHVGNTALAVMLSGRSLFRFGEDVTQMDDEMPLLPQVLRERGYTTYATGRWVNGRDWFERSFDHGEKLWFGDELSPRGIPVCRYEDGQDSGEAKRSILEGDPNEAFATVVERFIGNHPGGKPFMIYASFAGPKFPQSSPDSRSSEIAPLPVNFLREHPFDNGALAGDAERLLATPRVPTEVQREIARYYGNVAHLDEQIGRILNVLEFENLMHNTLVVFTSDNGSAIGSHGLLGDRNLYEHSVRVPLIIAGPGVRRAEHFVSLCYQMDLYPTICEMTETPVPSLVEGKSLTPILSSQANSIRTTVFSAFGTTQRAVRDHRFKLIYYPELERYQLFNLRSDPGETTDLFDSGEYGRDVNRLRIHLAAWQSSLDDPLR